MQAALARGHIVSTLVRTPAKLDPQLSSHSTVIEGDATDQLDIERLLMSGIDVLVHTVSVPFFHPNPTSLYARVSSAVIAAW
jgi:nucleoside-diphosphate-sugar epimerase